MISLKKAAWLTVVLIIFVYYFVEFRSASDWHDRSIEAFSSKDFVTAEVYVERALSYWESDKSLELAVRCRAMILREQAEDLLKENFIDRAYELAVQASDLVDDEAFIAWRDGIALAKIQWADKMAQDRQDKQNKNLYETWVLKAMRFESEGKYEQAENAYQQASKYTQNKIDFESNRFRITRKRVEGLIALLASPDRKLQQEARDKLLDIGDPAVNLLGNALERGFNLPENIYESLKQESHDQIVDAATRRIASTDPKVRAAVAWVLGRMKDPRSTNQILGMLKDPEPQVQVAALEALVAIGEPFEASHWSQKLHSGDLEFRRQIAAVFRQYPTDNSRKLLMEMAGGGSFDLREVVLWALGGDRHQETRVFLKKNIESLSDDRLKAQAILSLSSSAHVGDEDVLIKQLDALEVDSRSYHACVQGLGKFDDPISSAVLNRQLKNPIENIRVEALHQLSGRPEDVNFKRVLNLLEDDGQSSEIHVAALALMEKQPHFASPEILKKFSINKNRDIRIGVTKILEARLSVDSIQLALSLTQDSDPHVRRGASLALLAHRAEEGVIAVVPRLLASKNVTRIEEGLRLAGEFQEKIHIPLVSSFVTHDEVSLRIRSQVALSQLDFDDSQESLKLLSKDGSFHEKKYLAKVLGESQEPLHFEILLNLLDDHEPGIREETVSSIAMFGDPRSIEPLLQLLQDDVQAVRGLALWALSRFGPRDNRVAAALLTILRDRNSRVRMGAAILLGELGDKKAVASLTDGLQAEHYELRLACALSLGKLGSILGVPVLIEDLRRSSVLRSKEIVRALRTITGHTSAKSVSEWEAWWTKNS